MDNKTVVIDERRCVGVGQCVLVAPEVFDQSEDGVVVLLDEHPAEELSDQVREAVRICPGLAIELKE